MFYSLLFLLSGLITSCLALIIPPGPSIAQLQSNSSALLIPPTIGAISLQRKPWPATPFLYPVGRGLSLRIKYYGDQAAEFKKEEVLKSLTELQYWIGKKYPVDTEFEPLLIREGNVGVWFKGSQPLALGFLTAKQAILVLVGVSILVTEYGPRDIAEADVLVGGRVAMEFVLDIW